MSKEQENKKRDLEIRRIQLEKERQRKLNEQQKKEDQAEVDLEKRINI